MQREFGSQCIVVAIDTKFIDDEWIVFVNGGRTPTPLRTVSWARRAEELGAGEILLTSMNNDGTKTGFSIDITGEVSSSVNIPVIASGGAGSMDHFKEVFYNTGVQCRPGRQYISLRGDRYKGPEEIFNE